MAIVRIRPLVAFLLTLATGAVQAADVRPAAPATDAVRLDDNAGQARDDDARATFDRFLEAWNVDDAAVRARLLEATWADDAVYVDPGTGEIRGRAALLDYMAALRGRFPGSRVELTSGIDIQHGRLLRFTWRMRAADGSLLVDGTDFGELDKAGRIARLVVFLGPLPERDDPSATADTAAAD
ncbi:MAG: nuclear transport factor 2 family protein [Acidobacteriota bacterium]